MRVYLINFGYFLQPTFSSLEAALAYGKERGFEFAVYDAMEICLASWSPIGGLRTRF